MYRLWTTRDGSHAILVTAMVRGCHVEEGRRMAPPPHGRRLTVVATAPATVGSGGGAVRHPSDKAVGHCNR